MSSIDSTAKSFDVAVVGGGVIGLAVAWRAAQRGLTWSCSTRAATAPPGRRRGHARAGRRGGVRRATTLLDARARAARAAGPTSPTRSPQASGATPATGAAGRSVVARDRDEAEALERELAYRAELGLRGRAPAAQRRPGAASPRWRRRVRLALDVPGDHAVDPRALRRRAAPRRCARAGGELARGRAGRRTVEQRSLAAPRSVVVAAGGVGRRAGARVPVRPVKGQILRLRDPAGPGLVDRVLRLAESYLVPRGDGRYVLGATVEERGFDTALTAGGVLRAAARR